MSVKNARVVIKAPKHPKSKKKKKPIEKAVSEQLPILLTANRRLTAKR